jgi:hypothetical protein
VDEDGNSARYVSDERKAWAQAFFNPIALSIEQIGFATDDWRSSKKEQQLAGGRAVDRAVEQAARHPDPAGVGREGRAGAAFGRDAASAARESRRRPSRRRGTYPMGVCCGTRGRTGSSYDRGGDAPAPDR